MCGVCFREVLFPKALIIRFKYRLYGFSADRRHTIVLDA